MNSSWKEEWKTVNISIYLYVIIFIIFMKKELFIILCVKYLELRIPTADSTLLIRLRLQSWTRCEEWGWQCDRMRYSTQTPVVFHFMCWLWPRFLFPSCLPAQWLVPGATAARLSLVPTLQCKPLCSSLLNLANCSLIPAYHWRY